MAWNQAGWLPPVRPAGVIRAHVRALASVGLAVTMRRFWRETGPRTGVRTGDEACLPTSPSTTFLSKSIRLQFIGQECPNRAAMTEQGKRLESLRNQTTSGANARSNLPDFFVRWRPSIAQTTNFAGFLALASRLLQAIRQIARHPTRKDVGPESNTPGSLMEGSMKTRDKSLLLSVRGANDTVELLAADKTFKSGSQGYFAGGRVEINGEPYQLTCSIVRHHSKPAEEQSKAA